MVVLSMCKGLCLTVGPSALVCGGQCPAYGWRRAVTGVQRREHGCVSAEGVHVGIYEGVCVSKGWHVCPSRVCVGKHPCGCLALWFVNQGVY
jgi:hypothetical protein